jgi:DNA polymerase III alpha subunit
MKLEFAEFHAYSAFSFLQGASQPEVMVRRAAELGCTAIAITDRMGFYGSARAHHAAKECGIRAVVGTMLAMPDGTHFPVLCATRDGYRMLSRHLTDHHLSVGAGDELPTSGRRHEVLLSAWCKFSGREMSMSKSIAMACVMRGS